ncbi:MAG: hypothetical protein LAT68_02790 [Cyclobacteriaceae bacterium]|nr:hypothetical protein [Cyclobacteriaceae bacterium]MCH8515232.1 hypothetical protein [Cyclobacteriaceae bacterium]
MNRFLEYVASNPDYLIALFLSVFVLAVVIYRVLFFSDGNDFNGGDGGIGNNGDIPPNIDLPPGVSWPKDEKEEVSFNRLAA